MGRFYKYFEKRGLFSKYLKKSPLLRARWRPEGAAGGGARGIFSGEMCFWSNQMCWDRKKVFKHPGIILGGRQKRLRQRPRPLKTWKYNTFLCSCFDPRSINLFWIWHQTELINLFVVGYPKLYQFIGLWRNCVYSARQQKIAIAPIALIAWKP